MADLKVGEVRVFLNNLSVHQVSDATIEKMIDFSEDKIESQKSSGATADRVKKAKLALAGFRTYAAYAAKLERSVGGLPPAARTNLEMYKEIALERLKLVMRTDSYKEAPVALTESLANVIEELTG